MKTLYKRFSLLIWLLLFFSMVKADETTIQNRFEFLKIPLENTTMVENGLTLAESIGGVSVSTLINTGLWFGMCKASGVIVQLVRKCQFTEPEKKELEAIKTDFCAQLAPLVATAETMLAGKVSPWPLEPAWWRPLFLSVAIMSGYNGYMKAKNDIKNIPAAIMTYLTAEALSRTLLSAGSTALAKKGGVTHISDHSYDFFQHLLLSFFTGIVTSSIVNEALHYKGIKSVKVAFISMISGITAGVLSSTIFITNADLRHKSTTTPQAAGNMTHRDSKDTVIAIAGVIAGAGVGAGIVAGAATGAAVGAAVGTGAGAIAGAGAGVTATAIAMTKAGAVVGVGAEVGVSVGAGAGTAVGTLVGAAVGTGATISIHKLAQKNPVLGTAAAAGIATTLALINSLSGYVVYGYPLEHSLSETSQVIWKKFYAPLDYLSTLLR